MICNLLFDMGGVVLPMNVPEEPVRRFAQLGLSQTLAQQYFGRWGQRGIFRAVEDGTLSPEEFLRAYESLTGYSATFEEISWAWRGFILPAPPKRLALLHELRAKGYHLALVSNTNPFLQHWEESADFCDQGVGIQSFFDRLWYSYELKAYKPDAYFFDRLLVLGEYQPQECLFLDDALHNVEAARAVGIAAIHVPNNEDWEEALRNYLKKQENYS